LIATGSLRATVHIKYYISKDFFSLLNITDLGKCNTYKNADLFPPCDIGGSGSQPDAVCNDECHAQAHDDEQGLQRSVLLQGLQGHALKGRKTDLY
jgi:hypothetical protein